MTGYVINALWGLLIPFAGQYINLRDENNKKKRLITSGMVTGAVMIITLVLWLIYKDDWTVFEFLGVEAAISGTVICVIVPIIRKERITIYHILKFVCVLVYALIIYSTLTYGQTYIHSDTATASILARCQIESKSFFPKTWVYGHGDIWTVSNNLFTLPFAYFLRDQSLARMLGSAAFMTAAIASIIFQSEKGFLDHSWILSFPILFVFLTGDVDIIRYQAAYTGSILGLPLITMLFFMAVSTSGSDKKRKIIYVILFLAWNTVGVMSGLRDIAENVLPLLFIPVYMFIEEINEEDCDTKKSFKTLMFSEGLILLSTIIGRLLYKWVCSHSIIKSEITTESLNMNGGIVEIFRNIGQTVIDIYNLFGFNPHAAVFSIQGLTNFINILICTLTIFVIPVLQLIKFKNESKYVKSFIVFGIMHNAALLAIITCVEGSFMIGRYFITSMFISIIISCRYIYEYWIKQIKKGYPELIAAAFVIMTVIVCIPIFGYSKDWTRILEQRESLAKQLTEKGLKKGYTGDYWDAYSNEVYSDFDVVLGSCIVNKSGMYPYYWLVDSKTFEPWDGDTFLMLDEETNAEVAPFIAESYGEPKAIYGINGKFVYVFDYDIVENAINGMDDNIISFNELAYCGNVKKSVGEFEINNGGMVYGPYWEMKKGTYHIIYHGKNLNKARWDISSSQKPDAIEFSSDSVSSQTIDTIATLSEDVPDLEIRTANDNNGKVYLNYIEIYPMEDVE